MSTSMSRPLDFHRGFPMKMSMTWTLTRSISTMTDLARRGSARVAQVTKMKLPEDRTLCAIGLDWKKQVRRIPLPLRTEWTPTKKKNLVTKMKSRLPQCFGVQVPMLLKRLWTCRNHRHSKKR
ncbi:hypothetical protein PC116_g29226 [Phytophthora cactorum]|nr:hypothetical protein PC116_g29226 [Phytophthora cactorum]